MVLCEIDLDYSDNYLAAFGFTEFYQPAITLDAIVSNNPGSLGGSTTDKSELVSRIYDDDTKTCSNFNKLKMVVGKIESTHIYKQILLLKLVMQPNTDAETTKQQVRLISDAEGLLNETIFLNKRTEVRLDPDISKGDNTITILDLSASKTGFTLCELKLKTAVDPERENFVSLTSKKRREAASLNSLHSNSQPKFPRLTIILINPKEIAK